MAGNKNSGRKAGKDFGPRVRGLFNIAIEECIADGSLLPKLKAQLKEDPTGTFRAMAGYVPKQVDMSMDHRVTLDTTKVEADDWAFVASIRKQIADGTVSH